MENQNPGNAPESGEDTQDKAPETSTPDTAPESGGKDQHMIPKQRLDQEISKRRETEKALASIADEMRDEIPEQFRGLVPEDLPPAKRIEWMRRATRSGLFSGPSNGPDTKRPGGKPQTDYSGMSPQEMIEEGLRAQK